MSDSVEAISKVSSSTSSSSNSNKVSSSTSSSSSHKTQESSVTQNTSSSKSSTSVGSTRETHEINTSDFTSISNEASEVDETKSCNLVNINWLNAENESEKNMQSIFSKETAVGGIIGENSIVEKGRVYVNPGPTLPNLKDYLTEHSKYSEFIKGTVVGGIGGQLEGSTGTVAGGIGEDSIVEPAEMKFVEPGGFYFNLQIPKGE